MTSALPVRINLQDWQSLAVTSGPGAQFFQFCDALEVKNGVDAPTTGWGLDHALAAWSSYFKNEYYPLSMVFSFVVHTDSTYACSVCGDEDAEYCGFQSCYFLLLIINPGIVSEATTPANHSGQIQVLIIHGVPGSGLCPLHSSSNLRDANHSVGVTRLDSFRLECLHHTMQSKLTGVCMVTIGIASPWCACSCIAFNPARI